MHIGEAKAAPLETIGQSLVVDPQQVEESRMEIMHMNRIAHDIVAIFVSLPHGLTRLDAPTGKPHAEATRVMIPAEIVAIQFSLGVVGPAKLASPDHESVIAPPPIRGDAR